MDNLEQRRADFVARVKQVFKDAGVPPSAHAKTLSAIIGVAIAQAYRKLNGASDFTLPQIEAIETAYGVTLFSVCGDKSPLSLRGVRAWTNATLCIANFKLPCRAIIATAQKAEHPRYVAFLLRGEWTISLADEYYGSEPLFDVDTLTLITTE